MARHSRLRPQALLTDEPLLLHHPRARLIRILVLYAVLPLICAAAGAFIAYTLANARTDARVSALEADLAQRRAAANQANAARDRALAQYRRDLCVLIDRAQPRDPDVAELRRRYGCTGGPAPAPSGAASRNGAAGSSTSGARPAPAPPANPPAGPPGPAEPSGPPGPTAPAPAPTTPGHLELCLPLVDLCVL